MTFSKTVILTLAATLCHCEPPVHNYHSQLGHNRPSVHHAYNNAYIPPNYLNTGASSESFAPPSHSFGITPPASGFTPPSIGVTPPALGHGHGSGYDHHVQENQEPKSYEFGYAVKDAASGNDYGRREVSDGDTVRGEYRVLLPDGRTQIVTYHADWRTGYHADVRYEGEAHYPDQSYTHHLNKPGSNGYAYNTPSFGGSLSGFHGNGNSLPGYH